MHINQDHVERVQKLMNAELERALGANAFIAAAALLYVFVDTMGWAAMPARKRENQRADFIAWVDRYMTPYVPSNAEYRLSGQDLYQARCSLVHSFTAESSKTTKLFFYMDDGQPHRNNPQVDERIVILNLRDLKDEFLMAVARFTAEARQGEDGGALVASRFERMYEITSPSSETKESPGVAMP